MTKNQILIAIFCFIIGFSVLASIQVMNKPVPTKAPVNLTQHEVEPLKKTHSKELHETEAQVLKQVLRYNMITLYDGEHLLCQEINEINTAIELIRDSGEYSSEFKSGKLEYLQFERIYLTRIAKILKKAIDNDIDLSEEIKEQDMLRKRNLDNLEQQRYKH